MERTAMNQRPADNRKRLGAYGEQLAERYLREHGCHVLERNWRCRSGEIDLIAMDGEVVVFIEVRTRRMTGRFGTPQESVNHRKQKQVRDTSQVYLHMNNKHDCKVRFDLISVKMDA